MTSVESILWCEQYSYAAWRIVPNDRKWSGIAKNAHHRSFLCTAPGPVKTVGLTAMMFFESAPRTRRTSIYGAEREQRGDPDAQPLPCSHSSNT